MAYIQEGSDLSMLLENHLFYLPSTLTERWNTHDYDLGPSQATFDDAQDIVFNVAASHNELISLADVRFMCDSVVASSTGSKLTLSDAVTPVNNVLHSQFQSVSVQIGGRVVSDSSNMYHIRSYIESLLGYSLIAQQSQLSCSGWKLDTELHLEYLTDDKLNFRSEGAVALQKIMVEAQPLQLSGKLHCDLFQQDKPLVPGVELVIRLVRNKAALCFMSKTAETIPKVAIRNPRLRIRKYEPTPDYMSAMSKQLLKSTAKYHIERVAMRQLTLMQGQQHAVWANVVIGQLPKVMFFAMIPSIAFTGTHKTTPYNFHHFNLSSLSAEIDGQLYPTRGYELDFATHSTLTAYEGLLDTLERLNEPGGELPFDRFSFENGYSIFGFDFTPGHTGRGNLSLIKQGNLNLNLKFSRPLVEGVICIAMLVFDNIIEINNNRQVIFDFAP